MNFCGSLCAEKKLPTYYPFKSHDHDHQWADLILADYCKTKENVNIKLLDLCESLVVYILSC